MNNLSPPIPSHISTIIVPQAIPSVALVAASVNVVRSFDSGSFQITETENRNHNITEHLVQERNLSPVPVAVFGSAELLSSESSLEHLEAGKVSDTETEEPSFVVSDLLAQSGGNLVDVDADKFVDAIISIKDDTNNSTESTATQHEENIAVNIEEKIESVAANDNVEDKVEAKSAKRVVKRGGAKKVERKVGGNFSIGISREVVDIEAGLCPVYKPIFAARTQFHRIAEARLEQGLSISRAAKRLHISIDEAREQEKETTDLKLSQLYEWRDILEVSVGELVLEPEEIPANPVKNRCQLIRLMKSVRAIIDETKNETVLIIARQMETWLIELMPELENVVAWPSVGQSRDHQSPGAAATRCLGFGNIYLRRNLPRQDDNK
ncbi:MAG: helix-turn-helix domain-containing protein [Planctomycetaceae bacterium]|jgi:transcriptional regulator with XRE-family HTH domain|nr:helix-turn-helix domain-containing protein [Planctomycetaceae bacterium]